MKSPVLFDVHGTRAGIAGSDDGVSEDGGRIDVSFMFTATSHLTQHSVTRCHVRRPRGPDTEGTVTDQRVQVIGRA